MIKTTIDQSAYYLLCLRLVKGVWMTKIRILSKAQWGFRKGYSSQYSITAMIEKCRGNLGQGGICEASFTDLSKAFDWLVHVLDLFLFLDDDKTGSYADDTTPYAMKGNTLQLLKEIENNASSVFNWFSAIYFKANPRKSHFLLTSKEQVNLNLDYLILKTGKSEKLLGINIDHFLTFNEHVSKLCEKASQNLHAIAGILSYLNKYKLRLIMNVFFSFQFGYCPLVWKDYKSSFAELLSEDKSFTVHHKNVQKLAIEMYKVKNELCQKSYARLI